MFSFMKFWLYINIWINHYIGFFQLRAEGVPVKGTKGECYQPFPVEILGYHI